MPLKLAGMRTLPPASVATQKGTMPAEMDDPAPLDEPPG